MYILLLLLLSFIFPIVTFSMENGDENPMPEIRSDLYETCFPKNQRENEEESTVMRNNLTPPRNTTRKKTFQKKIMKPQRSRAIKRIRRKLAFDRFTSEVLPQSIFQQPHD